MTFEVQLASYAGPLHVLLELIETRKLPITDVSLAQVAEGYLAYMKAHEPPPDELADFLVVAARLLLIKSHEILPRQEELEEEKSTLASQLELYQLFVRAAGVLDTQHQNTSRTFARARADVVSEGFVVPEGLTTTHIAEAFAGMLKRLEPLFRLQQTAMERVVSVKERLNEIREALLQRSRLTFADMLGKGRSKVDVVVSFLALLELLKQQTVHAVQAGEFGDIEVRRVD